MTDTTKVREDRAVTEAELEEILKQLEASRKRQVDEVVEKVRETFVRELRASS